MAYKRQNTNWKIRPQQAELDVVHFVFSF